MNMKKYLTVVLFLYFPVLYLCEGCSRPVNLSYLGRQKILVNVSEERQIHIYRDLEVYKHVANFPDTISMDAQDILLSFSKPVENISLDSELTKKDACDYLEGIPIEIITRNVSADSQLYYYIYSLPKKRYRQVCP